MTLSSAQAVKNWIDDRKNLPGPTSQEKALNLFKKAAELVPAYTDFLKKNRIKSHLIRSINDFKNIPPVTKENYIQAYPLNKRAWHGNLRSIHFISTSSGTTGEPIYWPRNFIAEIEGAIAHEYIFKTIFSVNKKKTLFVNGFPLGSWIAGTFTMACTNLLSLKGYPLVSITPGYVAADIISAIKHLHRQFDQVIVCGHSPFLKELIEEGKKELDWKKIDVKFLGTGQMITENWRDYLLHLLGKTDYQRTIISLYGSADAALIGFETPLSISIRRLLNKNPHVSQKIFHDIRLPSLCQYDPYLNYLETIEGEICLTKDMGCPLIRYNIHDRGGVLKGDEFRVMIDSDELKKNKLPFVFLFGREKFMVKIYGAIVYPEHVQSALNHPKLQKSLTGRFLLEIVEDKSHNPQLVCHTELAVDKVDDKKLAKLVKEIFIQEVARLNNEYRDVLKKMGKRVEPNIRFRPISDPKYFPKGKIVKTV